jgi:hypothetical protein
VLQDLHVSVQALLQQTPSTQNPLPQSPAHPQAAPLAPLILLVPLQAAGASAPPSGTDPSARSALEWLPHPAATRPTHPTTTAPKNRAARKLIISAKRKPGSSAGKTRARLRHVIVSIARCRQALPSANAACPPAMSKSRAFGGLAALLFLAGLTWAGLLSGCTPQTYTDRNFGTNLGADFVAPPADAGAD